jgi:hypothetical protein
MRAMLSVRFAGVALALFIAGLVSFPSFPTTGAGLFSTPAAISVNRVRKGDRQPPAKSTVWQREFGMPVLPAPSPPRARIPIGCDAAFSPISSPHLANVFRRCLA